MSKTRTATVQRTTRPRRSKDGGTERSTRGSRFIILTGLSGSGKSQAIRALEDLGYFCVDNLPTMLIPMLADIARRARGEISRVAIVVDVREGAYLSQLPGLYKKLQADRHLNPRLIFLEASDAALVRRFSETRRPHPLAHDRSVIEGIQEERAQLQPIRRLADQILDTSDLTVHELRQAFMASSTGRSPRAPLVVTLLSFGFKHGIPVDSDLVFDVRFLPNPHFVPGLRHKTGRDAAAIRYMNRSPNTPEFIARLAEFLRFLIPQYIREGKAYLTVAIGCTGGRHRSVMVTEAVRRALPRIEGASFRVKHRDIANE